MATAKHTPTPWQHGIYEGEPTVIEIWTSEKTPIGSDKVDVATVNLWSDAPEESVANAAFICKAVNCHDSLLSALKGVVAIADRKTVEFDRARAALAKAEGR